MASTGAPRRVDLVVRSRRILGACGWIDGEVGIRDGVISHLGRPDGVEAARTIDTGDRAILPGLVDTHAHMRDPGFTHKEDWAHGSRAAAVGGVTTVIDMPNVEPPPNTVERFVAHRNNAARQSIVDFGHHASPTVLGEIAGLAAAGATGFKIFMKRDVARSYPHMPGTAVDDHARLYEICEAVATTGKPLLIHPDDQALAELFAARAWAREGRDFRAYARALRAGDGVTLDVGIATMLALQRATGVRLHLLHVSTPGGWALVREAKAAGRPVTAEVNPFHLLVVNDWETIERWGPYALGSWIPPSHAEATWEAVLDGTADVIGSDHTPHAEAEKERGWDDMFATPGGSPTIQHYLPLLLTAVHDRRLTIERLAELCAAAPARLIGLEGVKGAIAVGADADLVIVDLERRHVIRRHEVLSKCGWTILDGREVTGVPVMTIVRGQVIAEEGRIVGEGPGQWIGMREPASAIGGAAPGSRHRDRAAAMGEPRSIWLPGDGIRVHGLEWGRVPSASHLVLLLHGVAGNAWIWDDVARRLRASVDDSWRIVAIDGRDGGETDHPPLGYEPERFAADLVAVHDELGGMPLTLVGHSRGGWLAAWFAQRYPERVERLVLVDPARLAFASGTDADRFYEWVSAGLGPFPSSAAALEWARSRDPEAAWSAGRVRSFLHGLVERADGMLIGRLPPHVVEQLRAARESVDSVGPSLPSIRCPTLLLVATRESEARRRDKLQYADGLRDVRVEEVAGSHFLHTDAPDAITRLIVAFIGDAAGPADPVGVQAAAPIPSSRRP